MSLDVERQRLWSAYESLRVHWDQAQQGWRDAVKKEFAEQHWAHIEPHVRRVMDAIDQVTHKLIAARRDCTEEAS